MKKRITLTVTFLAEFPPHVNHHPVLERSLTEVLSEWIQHNYTLLERDEATPLMTVTISDIQGGAPARIVDLENPERPI